MNNLKNFLTLTDPIKVKEILNTYGILGSDPKTKIENVKISILQSYQDKKSYNIKARYSVTLKIADKKLPIKNIAAAFSWPRNREYGYSMGNYIFDELGKTTRVSVPEQYAYIKKYNLILMEYMPGQQLTKIITKNKNVKSDYVEALIKWLTYLQRIKPNKKIRRTVNFYHLENNIRILKERKVPEAELLDKEFKTIRKAITGWSKEYQQALVHGDFNPANILINRSSITVLDFENVHYGDKLMDVANLTVYILMILKNSGADFVQLEKTEKYIVGLYEKYTKPLEAEEKNRLEVYKQYFILLFKTHPLVWGTLQES